MAAAVQSCGFPGALQVLDQHGAAQARHGAVLGVGEFGQALLDGTGHSEAEVDQSILTILVCHASGNSCVAAVRQAPGFGVVETQAAAVPGKLHPPPAPSIHFEVDAQLHGVDRHVVTVGEPVADGGGEVADVLLVANRLAEIVS